MGSYYPAHRKLDRFRWLLNIYQFYDCLRRRTTQSKHRTVFAIHYFRHWSSFNFRLVPPTVLDKHLKCRPILQPYLPIKVFVGYCYTTVYVVTVHCWLPRKSRRSQRLLWESQNSRPFSGTVTEEVALKFLSLPANGGRI